MSRATMAVALVACLTLAGCSSDPDVVATNLPSAGAVTTTADPAPTEEASPLDGLSAVEVWEKTKADAADAESFHVAARLVDEGQKVAINLKVAKSGKAFGALVFNGNKITIRRLGRTLYYKGDRGFWTANADAATATALADKWIVVNQSAAAEMAEFFELTDMDFILDDALSLTAAEQKALKLAPGIDIGTQKTVGLTEAAGSEKGEFQTLYVADADPALPLNFAMATDNGQYMKFRGWGKDFNVVAPKGAIDLANG